MRRVDAEHREVSHMQSRQLVQLDVENVNMAGIDRAHVSSAMLEPHGSGDSLYMMTSAHRLPDNVHREKHTTMNVLASLQKSSGSRLSMRVSFFSVSEMSHITDHITHTQPTSQSFTGK